MRIAILDDFQSLALSYGPWAELPPEVEVVPFPDHVADEDLLVARLKEFDAICRMRERTVLPARVLERLPKLKLVLCTGGRNTESLDLDACIRLNITVCETASFDGPPVELCWGLILSIFRGIHSENASVRSGGWQVQLGKTVAGRRLGIVGLGRHGMQIAKIAQLFGMEVAAWSPNLTDERAAAAGVKRVDKKDLFAESDVVTLHMPLSSRSVGIVGASELALLRPSAYLINISRGALVDEPALIDALTRRSFAGYAADVFEVEPLPLAHPFRFLPNVLATPHNGYVVGETFEIMYRETVENIQAYLAGKPIRVVRRDAQKHGQSPPTHG